MTHRFPIKEIAAQSGLGPATVDRVINNRAHVSAQTRARVAAAIKELETQEGQLAARGRRMFFDFVVEAPVRFSAEVKRAAEAVVPSIQVAVCRSRFLMQEQMTEDEVAAALERIAKRGSQGLVLKARNTTRICDAVNRLHDLGIPTVTLVTDLECARLAYVGLDNVAAGKTAAFLVSKAIGAARGCVLTTKSHDRFQGEEDRETAFIQTLEKLCPHLTVVDATGGSGLNYETRTSVSEVLGQLHPLKAVYSMGGGNAVIHEVLHDHGLSPDIYVAHDLDAENRALIAKGHLDFILHHDLQADLKQGFHVFLGHHGLVRDLPECRASLAQIITPFNVPDQNKTR